LEILQLRNHELAERVCHQKERETFFVVKSQSGLPTLMAVGKSGMPRFFHSPQDPRLEAKRLLEGYEFKGEDGTILFGLGLGYLAKEIACAKACNHVLYVVEGSVEIIRLAMTYMDLSDIILSKKIHLFAADSPSEITGNLRPIQAKAISGTIHKIYAPHLRDLFSQEYEQIDKLIEKHIRSLQLSYRSFIVTEEQRLDNLFDNIPFLRDSLPIDHLTETLKHKPALVIAAGPSLSGDIPVLKKRARDVFIIAVDTALKPLLENGIIPNLVATCESHSSKLRAIAGIPDDVLTEIPLVFSPTANSQLVQRFGRKFVVNIEDSLASWFVDMDRKVGMFSDLQTVSKMGFLVSRLMGANPIIFVGLDLAFPMNREHAEGCARTWKIDFQNQSFVWVPDNNGGKVKTIEGFVSMIHSLGMEVGRTQARCINVSRYGAYVEGSEWMALEEALKLGSWSPEGDDGAVFRKCIAKTPLLESSGGVKKYSDSLVWMLKQIEGLVKICEENSYLEWTPLLDNKKVSEAVIKKMSKDYESLFLYKDFLDIVTDYLPEYMTYCSWVASRIAPDLKRCWLLFKELNTLLPVLAGHCRKASAKLQRA